MLVCTKKKIGGSHPVSIGLDESKVQRANGHLEGEKSGLLPTPYQLATLKGQYFQGQDIMGQGFELNAEERAELLSLNPPSSADVILPVVPTMSQMT